MPGPGEITVSQLARLVGTPDAPVVVDLRIEEDAAGDPRLVPGAFRHAHTNLASLGPRLAGRRAVVYCQKGRKISQGAAAVLRGEGIACEVLEGGQFAWAAAGAPMIAAEGLAPLRQRRAHGVGHPPSPRRWRRCSGRDRLAWVRGQRARSGTYGLGLVVNLEWFGSNERSRWDAPIDLTEPYRQFVRQVIEHHTQPAAAREIAVRHEP